MQGHGAQAAGGCSASGSGRLGKGVCWDGMCLGGQGIPSQRALPGTSALLFRCCLVAGLRMQPEPAQGSSAAPATLHIAVLKKEWDVPAWSKVRESL